MCKKSLLLLSYTSFNHPQWGPPGKLHCVVGEPETPLLSPSPKTPTPPIYHHLHHRRLRTYKIQRSESQTRFVSMPPETPPNFWGHMPEEEYYSSQGVRNTKSYFDTPNGKLFTQSFLPLDREKVKGSVFMTHGYGSDTGWLFQKICISFASWGYAVFAADLPGHGRSDGLRCYLGDLEKIAATSLSFFLHVRRSELYRDLPAFLFGESMGGATAMLMYFQSEPNTWTGLIFSAPLFVMPENMKPSKVRLFMYGMLFGIADTWAAMPDNKMVGKAIKDPEKLKIIASNPRRYTGKPRVGTMRELARVCQYIQDNFGKVTAPFLTVHGTSDGVTCPTSSKLLYEKASSEDKSLKLYEGMYHSLIQGEPDDNANLVLADMREWIDSRVERYGSRAG
ncbi:caffeoylshikimate esterase [Corylus avellana]|uniref:caffeoylshikimate esterase n=1 Tax=Corylus avellana TaxID=13451 RepID=UPI00286C9733|nr:caffeoylshikimate esterase [Corylus avellana]